jgi:hypothetical protein
VIFIELPIWPSCGRCAFSAKFALATQLERLGRARADREEDMSVTLTRKELYDWARKGAGQPARSARPGGRTGGTDRGCHAGHFTTRSTRHETESDHGLPSRVTPSS